MIEHICKIRVRYSETDQMGYVYYGNYASYYEVARVEMLRSLGTSYKEMEENGIMMPVLELKSKYIKPAYYDEELKISVKILEKPQTRIKFQYEIFNEKEELINIGETTLVFVDIKKNRPGLPSVAFEKLMAPYFN
jgi:acyl-CoA thioester hydrolase